MKRAVIIVLALALFTVLFDAPANSQIVYDKEDSLRASIVRLIENGRILENDYNKASLDSAFLMFDSAATIAVNKYGKSDTLYIKALLGQAYNRGRAGEWNRVIDFAQKALNDIDSARVGNEDLRLEALDNLAGAYVQNTDFINGARISEEIIDTINKYEIKTKYHQQLINESTIRISVCRLQQGDLSYKSFEFWENRLESIRKEHGSDSRKYARAYLNTGYGLLYRREFEKAEEYICRGDSLVKKAFPPEDHTSTYSSIMVMLYYIARGRLRDADSLLQSEFEIVNRTFGKQHMHYPLLVRRQAQLLLAEDSLDMAIEKARELVDIYKDRFNHPTMMLIQALRLLGKIGFVAGNNEVYNQATDELAEIKLTYLFNAFRYASESLKLSYVRRYPLLESILFSGIVNNPKPEIISSAVEMVLNGKGLAFDAMAAQQAAALCSEEPRLDSLLDEHTRISDRIAGIVLASKESSAETLDELFSRKDQIESEISSFCASIGFAEVRERVKVGEILKSLPDNSVFLDFVKYEHYDYESHRPYGRDSMYAAIVYAPGRQVEVIGLGYSGEIENLITRYHEDMADALADQLKDPYDRLMTDYVDVARELYQRLVSPLPPFVRSTEKIFICADGIMNLLPFETLTEDGKKFLIEDHQFVYLTSGRDLVKKESNSGGNIALVLADPDFTTDPAALRDLATSDQSLIYASRGNSTNPECLASMFAPLPLTRREGSEVADLLSRAGRYNVTYLEAEMAREGVLKNLGEVPDIIHIATHGYFCQQAEDPYLSNPLLRSGLILAGANRTIGSMNEEDYNGEDGILTAMEVSGLNLIGTDLVVLSACQTGIGDIQSGEGVIGLRRAFQHAGARSVIISMFAVPDESTSDLMERFYENWLSGKAKSSALHEASLSILREYREKSGSAHPIFWGGFVLIGDPE